MTTYLETCLDLIKILPCDLKRKFTLLQQLDKKTQDQQYKLEESYRYLYEQACVIPIAVRSDQSTKSDNPSSPSSEQSQNSDSPIKYHIVGPEEEKLREIREDQLTVRNLIDGKIALVEQCEHTIETFITRMESDLYLFSKDIGESVAPPRDFHSSRFRINSSSSLNSLQHQSVLSHRASHSTQQFHPYRTYLPKSVIALMTPNIPVLRTPQERRPSATLKSSNHIVTGSLATEIHRSGGGPSQLRLGSPSLSGNVGSLTGVRSMVSSGQIPHVLLPTTRTSNTQTLRTSGALGMIDPLLTSRSSLLNSNGQFSSPTNAIGSLTSSLLTTEINDHSTNINRNRSTDDISGFNLPPALEASSTSMMGYDETKPYCICQQPSYGDMVACDRKSCKREWFHFSCVGLSSKPTGTWICDECRVLSQSVSLSMNQSS